jgi:hypothetical protein
VLPLSLACQVKEGHEVANPNLEDTSEDMSLQEDETVLTKFYENWTKDRRCVYKD